jgi:hypothetical protein
MMATSAWHDQRDPSRHTGIEMGMTVVASASTHSERLGPLPHFQTICARWHFEFLGRQLLCWVEVHLTGRSGGYESETGSGAHDSRTARRCETPGDVPSLVARRVLLEPGCNAQSAGMANGRQGGFHRHGRSLPGERSLVPISSPPRQQRLCLCRRLVRRSHSDGHLGSTFSGLGTAPVTRWCTGL